MASPIYIFHYQQSGIATISPHKGGHLFFGVYPCLKQKMGCGEGNVVAVEKVKKIDEEIVVKFFKNDIKNT